MCVNEPYELYGNFNSKGASNLMVVFERCDPGQRICKSDEEINEWMSFKYLVVIDNEQKFDLMSISEFEKQRISVNSNIIWHSMTMDYRQDTIRRLTYSEYQYPMIPTGILQWNSQMTYNATIFSYQDAGTRILMPYRKSFL